MAFGLPNISFVGYPVPIPCAGHAGLGLREVLRSDVPEIIEHLRALDAEDRRMRFCASVNDGHVVRHAEELLERSSFALAAHDGPLWSGPFHRPGPIRALAEFSVHGLAAEIGISVDKSLRRRGVATYLIQTSARLLQQRGVKRIVAYTMAENRSFLTLARKAGAEIVRDASEVEVFFDVDTLNRTYLQRRVSDQVFHRVA
ncbi:GNAT family N-acetyltransferase [Rhodobacteraceae bacterium DSL-40]|uniref:GNAT family N-acetyltransferase n=1 Tax=Amaricoccus sp. B4 TaxID=3368557 RepID=UPI0013A6F21A